MNAQEKKGTTNTSGASFDRLTIDDVTRSTPELLDQLQRSGKKEAWELSIIEAARELADLQGGSLPVMTSGTTGPPKVIPIPQGDLVASAQLTGDTFGLHEGDRALHCLPCDFIAGKMMLVRAFVLGLDLHLIDPHGSVLDHLKTHDRFRFAAMVPLQLHRALREDRERVERQFELILLGGGPVSDALIHDLLHLRVKVFQGYGSTETVTHVALRKINGADRSDHFTALGRVAFALDERNCLVVRTPHLSTKEHVTNDLVELIDDRHFRWLGRIDNVILSGGKKIFPERLESKTAGIIPYPHYFTSAPDERLGQCVMLVIETDRPGTEVRADVLDRLSHVLHPHEIPRRIKTVSSIKRTTNGKIIRSGG